MPGSGWVCSRRLRNRLAFELDDVDVIPRRTGPDAAKGVGRVVLQCGQKPGDGLATTRRFRRSSGDAISDSEELCMVTPELAADELQQIMGRIEPKTKNQV